MFSSCGQTTKHRIFTSCATSCACIIFGLYCTKVTGLFFDLTASDSSKNEDSEGKRESSEGDDGGGGGSSGKPPGGDWWKNLFDNPQQILIAAAFTGAAALFLLFSGIETREINWQEFRTKYLERGEVRL